MSPPDTILLAFDAGTSSVRAQLFRLPPRQGEPAQEAGPLVQRVYSAQPDVRELDPVAWAEQVEAALREAAAGQAPVLLAGATFFHGLLGLDPAGQPLTPLYTWADTASSAAATRLAAAIDPVAYHQQTGCFLHPCFPLARLARLRQDQPSLWSRVRRWVSPAGWLHRCWTGRPTVSHAIAAGSGLYDLSRQTWLDDDFLQSTAGLGRERLESLLPAGPPHAPLPLPPAAGGACRLPASLTRFLPVLPDAVASNLGAGCLAPNRFALNLGTSGAIRAVVPEPLARPLPADLFCYRIDARRALLGGAVSNCGNLVQWLGRTLRLDPWPRSYAALAAAVRTAAPGAAPRASPDLAGQRSPQWPAGASGAWTGLRGDTTPEAMALAMLDAVADQLAAVAAALVQAVGRPACVVAGGGGTADSTWVERISALTGLPIELAPRTESTLAGVAVHAASLRCAPISE